MNVTIDTNADRRLWAFIRAVDTEIGGWGYARLDGSDLTWYEVFLVPQEVSGAEVDFEATGGDAAAVERAIADDVLADPSFVWVSWHSHHTMEPYWSKTDESRIAAIAKTGVKRLLSFVGSHNGDYKLRLDVFDVQAHDIALPQVSLTDLRLESPADDEFTASIKQDIAANVTRIKSNLTPSWLDSRSLPAPWPDDDSDLGVEEELAVRYLVDHGFTRDQAILAVGEVGVEGVSELVEADGLDGRRQKLQLGGTS